MADKPNKEEIMSDEQINYMVNRFLGWKLPMNFSPDAGISFTAPETEVWWPTGTNLLDATQAEHMVRYLVEGTDLGLVGSDTATKGDGQSVHVLTIDELPSTAPTTGED
jgi:hypothetical protein